MNVKVLFKQRKRFPESCILFYVSGTIHSKSKNQQSHSELVDAYH